MHHRRDEFVHLTEAAAAVALSVLLGNVRLLELPNGGSIALATLPLLALATVRGTKLGVLAGACAGIAHALAGGTIIHPVQLGLDYLLAYAALGLAGIAAGRGTSRAALAPAIVLAMSLHLALMVVSGIVFFSTVAGSAALEYALAYNAVTVIPETILALWLVAPLTRSLARANPADAWRRGLLSPPRAVVRTARSWAPEVVDVSLTQPPPRLTPPPVSRPAPRTTFVRPSPFTNVRSGHGAGEVAG